MLLAANIVIFALLAVMLLFRSQPTSPLQEARQELATLLSGSQTLASLNSAKDFPAPSIVALFSKINTTCGAHQLIEQLREWERSHPRLGVVIVLSSAFQEHDVRNLRENFGLPFAVTVADQELQAGWTHLEERRSVRTLNGSLFLQVNGRLRPAASPRQLAAWLSEAGPNENSKALSASWGAENR
ncbi:MAG TPA: hypothetical protein VLU25_17500 [Acidobacteriota bacterium]|nr:hypothetical protein [Acidobacteriota bacterium]